MSIRCTISLIDNPSGSLHLYSEAGCGDICIQVDTTTAKLTHYGDMYLTINELEELQKEINHVLEFHRNLSEEGKLQHLLVSHKYDDRLEEMSE
jgi:hypothetical protein